MNLTDFTTQYISLRRLSPDYETRLRKRAAAFQLHAGKAALADLLTEAAVNAFLRSLVLGEYTVRCYRADLLTLWNAAADDDLVPYPLPRRIYRTDVTPLLVECYTVEEARELRDVAKLLKGNYPNGVARREYWAAAIPLAWDTGIRRGDVWRFRREFVRRDGVMRMMQGKTKKPVRARLRDSTVAALDKIGRKQPCEWPIDPTFFGKHFQRLVKASGVGRGTFRWLRRSSGSYVDAAHPGAGYKHLGHTSPGTFDRHYDAKLGDDNLPAPPEL
jgi:integrase